MPCYLDKKKRDEEKAKRDANDHNISEYFMKGQATAQQKQKPKVDGILWPLKASKSIYN